MCNHLLNGNGSYWPIRYHCWNNNNWGLYCCCWCPGKALLRPSAALTLPVWSHKYECHFKYRMEQTITRANEWNFELYFIHRFDSGLNVPTHCSLGDLALMLNMNGIFRYSCDNALMNSTHDLSKFGQVMTWCHQAHQAIAWANVNSLRSGDTYALII